MNQIPHLLWHRIRFGIFDKRIEGELLTCPHLIKENKGERLKKQTRFANQDEFEEIVEIIVHSF